MAEYLLEDEKLFVVDLHISAKRIPGKVTLYIDGDQGATIEDCAHLSRVLSKELDETNLIPDHYTLEVSTPGVDHPLQLKRQYKKNVGRNLKISLKSSDQLKGKLVEVGPEFLKIEEEIKEGKKILKRETRVAFEEIDRALVMISFN